VAAPKAGDVRSKITRQNVLRGLRANCTGPSFTIRGVRIGMDEPVEVWRSRLQEGAAVCGPELKALELRGVS